MVGGRWLAARRPRRPGPRGWMCASALACLTLRLRPARRLAHRANDRSSRSRVVALQAQRKHQRRWLRNAGAATGAGISAGRPTCREPLRRAPGTLDQLSRNHGERRLLRLAQQRVERVRIRPTQLRLILDRPDLRARASAGHFRRISRTRQCVASPCAPPCQTFAAGWRARRCSPRSARRRPWSARPRYPAQWALVST